jgi:hypothetical protein
VYHTQINFSIITQSFLFSVLGWSPGHHTVLPPLPLKTPRASIFFFDPENQIKHYFHIPLHSVKDLNFLIIFKMIYVLIIS